jgi:hypothetical protein
MIISLLDLYIAVVEECDISISVVTLTKLEE